MYMLNKIVGFLVSPVGGVIAGVMVTIACGWLNYRRLVKWVGCSTAVWLWLWMTPVMTRVVGGALESEFMVDGKVPLVESFPKADAIILHGGSMGIQTNLSAYAEMWGSADRVWQAARLWKAGKAPKIIATGDGAKESTLGLLKELGVEEDCVEFLDARNTEEEARRVRGNLEGKGKDKRLLLVTSAWHMKRARMMFEKYAKDVEIVCAPADFECTMLAKRGWSILPDPNAFNLNSIAFHEWVGIVGYKLFR